LKTLPTHSVDCIVTSPPYFRQREYAARENPDVASEEERQAAALEIGREETPQAYVDRLVAVFTAAREVLRDSGTLWLNLGDKYERGELLGMPWRVALALKDAGWRLRADCIWQKPNAMPSAVKDRPTVDHEYVFLFARSEPYFYDADAIREPHITFTASSRMKGGRKHFGLRGGTPENGKNSGDPNLHDGRWDQAFHPAGRNKRTVWSIRLGKCRESHFAAFPEPLVETCIKAGCPEEGTVLDPFIGSGVTAIVARRLGRSVIGIDCVPRYCEMTRRRLGETAPSS